MLIGLALAASAILTQAPMPAEGKPLPAPDCRRLLTTAHRKRFPPRQAINRSRLLEKSGEQYPRARLSLGIDIVDPNR
jgi:hypothetical protein